LFELYDINQPAELLLSYATPPAPGIIYRSAAGDVANPPQIVLRTSSGDPLSLLGEWYLQVVPTLAQDITFTIRAVTSTDGILPSGRPLGIRFTPAPGGGLSLTWNSVEGERYEIAWSVDLVNWALLDTITATGPTTSYTDTTTVGEDTVFYWIRQVP
jgi:hypothetical protein